MYNNVKDDIFDAILTTSFNEYLDIELSQMPSDEELAAMYPIPEKQVRKIQKYAKRLKHHLSIPVIYLRRFAVACLVIISLAFTVLATSPTVREAVKDTIVTWYEKYIQFDFAKADNSQNEITDIYELGIRYIPDGFELVSSVENKKYREYAYYSDSGEYLQISIYASSIANVSADIELAKYEAISIDYNDAYLLHNSTERDTILIVGNNIYTIYISALMDKSTVLQIAKNIN